MQSHARLKIDSAKRNVAERNQETTDTRVLVMNIAGAEGLQGRNTKTAGTLSNAIGGTVVGAGLLVADTGIKAGCTRTAFGVEAVSHTGHSMAWSMMMTSERSVLQLWKREGYRR